MTSVDPETRDQVAELLAKPKPLQLFIRGPYVVPTGLYEDEPLREAFVAERTHVVQQQLVAEHMPPVEIDEITWTELVDGGPALGAVPRGLSGFDGPTVAYALTLTYAVKS